MKGIRNGRQNVCRFLPETWKSLQEHNDLVNYIVYLARNAWHPIGDSCPILSF
jgi:hypothetical protein